MVVALLTRGATQHLILKFQSKPVGGGHAKHGLGGKCTDSGAPNGAAFNEFTSNASRAENMPGDAQRGVAV